MVPEMSPAGTAEMSGSACTPMLVQSRTRLNSDRRQCVDACRRPAHVKMRKVRSEVPDREMLMGTSSSLRKQRREILLYDVIGHAKLVLSTARLATLHDIVRVSLSTDRGVN